MNEIEIKIEFFKKQIVNDIGIQCNLVGKNLQSTAIQGMDTNTIAAGIMSPDDEEVKPVVARAMTEAWDEVKKVCQRYLVYGRENDDNRLEKINEMLLGPIRHKYTAKERTEEQGIEYLVIPRYTRVINTAENKKDISKYFLINGELQQKVACISPYLIPSAVAVIVTKRNVPFFSVPPMDYGSKPADGGFLILNLYIHMRH